MKTLNLPEEELARMQEFYEEELGKTILKLGHIKNVLEKLGADTTKIEITVTKSASSSSPAIEKTFPKTPQTRKHKKSGPKSIWGNFIIKRLRQLEKPVPYSELVDDAMVYFKIPDRKYNNVKQSILNSAFRLRNLHHKIDTYAEKGKKEKFVGLKKWFDNDGNLMKEYKEKIKTTKKS